ncbi:hypothetical protein KRX52_16195 [Pseudomonas sp. MAP12]|uniref:Chitinase n=1 Tax=Geopseudomonas aromaticivorans TaxID=2849492 RepID=A0ABS6N134_9GAMM|nr:hypothetical protein [Pseudomonas aromaticivorans]MBV2134321.1 hypothetical protein [Pseudomonas aromaticivorans]
MEEKQKKVERWSYPFKAKGSGAAASSEVTDPQIYYEALAKAESGYYPVASNGLWHGGVHFDQNTASILDQSSVRCIADGVVIAYRIDEFYKKLTYTGSCTSREVTYSTGFVLVKHRMELPPAPAATTPPAGTPPAAEPELTFYSLYMHLMDWENYEKAGAPIPPTFMCPTQYAVSEEGSTNDFSGLFVRGGAPGTPEHANKVAIIPKGCKVRVGEISSVDERWRKLVSILEGKASPALAPEIEHWVFPGEMSPTTDGDVFLIGEEANDVNASLLPGKGLTVRKEAKRDSAAMAVLPVGAKVQLEDGTGKYRKIKSITASTLSAPLSANCAPNIAGYIHFDSLKAASPETPPLRTVQVLPTPVPIQAGALIGHLGKYQAASQSEAHDLLHLEVFSCDDVETLVAQSRARAQQLKPEQKTLLKIPSETKVITKESASQANPPHPSDPGHPTAYDMILPLAVLNALPADKKITLTTTVNGATTTEQWWKLDNLPGKDGNPISGWVKEGEIMTPRLHAWDWEGFDFIKETSTPSEQYVCKLSADGVLDEGEMTNYLAQINNADGGPINERLYKIIDKNNDYKLTTNEIKEALKKPWHAQSISRLIVQYESEWHADPELSKWKALDCHMTKEGEKDWNTEKQRINELLWWSDLRSILTTKNIYHLHPTALIECFNNTGFRFTLDIMKQLYQDLPTARLPELKEIANEINNHIYFYKLDTPLRRAHFFAQILQETGQRLRTEEDLTYRVSGLTAKFKYFRDNPDKAEEHGFVILHGAIKGNGQPMNQTDFEAIANGAYGGRRELGNGNYASGDGWKYRGRGLKQLTGRANYTSFDSWHRENLSQWPGDENNFIENPDLLKTIKYAVRSAANFWITNNLHQRADTGSTPEAVDLITDIVNMNTDSRQERKNHFQTIWRKGIME